MIKEIKGYEGLYGVDELGNVYSLITNKTRRKGLLKPYDNKAGYMKVNLYKDKKCKHLYIHRLVAQTFIPNPENLSEVNHIDCNTKNNALNNLEWCDRKTNLQHAYDNGLKRSGEKHGGHKLTELEVRQIRKEYVKNDKNYSLNALAKKYNVNFCTIQAIIKFRLWKEVI